MPTLARWGTPEARRLLVTCVLGSSMAFLDGTVVNVALPRIGTDLDAGLAGLQWVINAYLISLSAFVLLGGSLGDRFGQRRVFLAGVAGFTAASLACGLAPGVLVLIVARGVQGAAAALLVPSSLALLTSTLYPDDRSRAVGAWSGLTAVAGAVGPLVGGALVDAASWRWVFFVNVPVAVAAVAAARGVADGGVERRGPSRVDGPGAVAAALGLGLLTAGVIEHGSSWSVPAIGAGIASLAVFAVVERRPRDPMLPLSLFRSVQFSGANAVTLTVYAGLGVATFLVMLQFQAALDYSAVEAGAALAPVTLLLLVLSTAAAAAAQRIGPRLPMTLGPALAAAGLAWLGQVAPGDRYVSSVLPALGLFGLGLAVTVAPLTAVVLAAVDTSHLGLASGVNNAVARLAGLVGVAVVPVVAGVELVGSPERGLPGYRGALLAAAGLCAAGAAIAAVTIRRAEAVRPAPQPGLLEPCNDPCRLEAPMLA